jgi:hypothetical protein
MGIINQELLDRIAAKLGISVRAVYPHISRVVSDTLLDRDIAALVLARRLGINIQRFSTPEQRAQLAGVRVSAATQPEAPAEVQNTRRQAAGRQKSRRRPTIPCSWSMVEISSCVLRCSTFYGR